MYGKIVRRRGTFRNGFEIRFEHPNGKHMDWMFVPKNYMADFIDDIMSAWMKLNGIDVWRFESMPKGSEITE